VWRHARSAHCSGTHVTATRARADARTGMRDVCTTRGEGAGLQHALEPRGTSTRALLLCVYVCACVLPRVCAIWTRQACAHFERHAHLRASATRMMPYGGMDYVCVCRSPCESCAVLKIAGDRHLTDQFFVLQPFFAFLSSLSRLPSCSLLFLSAPPPHSLFLLPAHPPILPLRPLWPCYAILRACLARAPCTHAPMCLLPVAFLVCALAASVICLQVNG
jgi:hypothetical protein